MKGLQKIKKVVRYLMGDENVFKPIVKVNVTYTNPSERFVGKRVLVTGGSSGIGYEIARQFLLEGASVMITGRREDALIKASKELSGDLHYMVWDVSDVSTIDRVFENAVVEMGGFDIFVNNAGICELGKWDSFDEASFDRHLDINAKGLFFMCKKEGMYLRDNKIAGKIVNITSIAGIKSAMDPYSVSKWGAVCITKGLAKELIKHGITVNSVAPGNVVTAIHKGYDGIDVKENAYCGVHPSGRYTFAEEIASLTLFLASGAANNIVGQVITVDGGRMNV